MKRYLSLCILTFCVLLFPSTLQAADLSKTSLAVSAGICLDLTPLGIEQYYAAVQAELLLPGIVTLGLKPMLAINSDSFMFRVPILGKLRLAADESDFTVSAYCGAGPEYYKSAEHEAVSPFLTGGLSFEAGLLYLDIPASVAFREYNTDTDLSVTAGLSFDL